MPGSPEGSLASFKRGKLSHIISHARQAGCTLHTCPLLVPHEAVHNGPARDGNIGLQGQQLCAQALLNQVTGGRQIAHAQLQVGMVRPQSVVELRIGPNLIRWWCRAMGV